MQRFGLFVMLIALPLPALSQILPTGPDAGDVALSPFYRWGARLSAKPGRVLREEPMPEALVPASAGKAVRQLYTSTDWRWKSGVVPVSGALYLPKGKAPRGGWPLIVWAHGTLGVSDACAPSWTGSNKRDRSYIDRWLAEGFAVAAPDYQGLGGPGPHPYLLWQAEGRSVLDAARAALRSGYPIANRIVITGQSQGSGAALGAARLAASYAPELAIKGAIGTALVTTFPDPTNPETKESPGGSPYYLIYRMMSGSMPDNGPPVDHYLSDKGRVMLAAARTRCDPRLVAEDNGVTMENAFSVSPAEADRAVGPVGQMDGFGVKFPLMLGIGLADELISPARMEHGVREICKAGNAVVRKGYEGSKHGETLTRSADDAVAFTRTVLAGQKVASTCP